MNLLLVGILLTNSRGVMVFTALAYLLILIFNAKARKKNFINLGIMAAIGLTAVFIMDKGFGIINRLSSISIYSGEWILRVLYYKDALSVIASNIFGHGYMAWWYMQEGLQTGAYDAQFVHNGLLQIVVDAGVIPALLVVATFIIGFFDKKVTARDRVLMLIILGHSLIDFNMEFLVITLVLFMTLEFDKKQELTKVSNIKITVYCCGLIYIFFVLVTTLNSFGQYEVANSMFPYSISLNKELEVANSTKRMEIAEKLYNKNKYFLNASTLLSQKEQYLGNYEKAYEYEMWIVKNKKYTMLNYIQYVQFLEKAIQHYYQDNNIETMKLYVNRLVQVEEMIENVKETSDVLAYKIAHKPRLDMPEEMKVYIEQMKEFVLQR